VNHNGTFNVESVLEESITVTDAHLVDEDFCQEQLLERDQWQCVVAARHSPSLCISIQTYQHSHSTLSNTLSHSH